MVFGLVVASGCGGEDPVLKAAREAAEAEASASGAARAPTPGGEGGGGAVAGSPSGGGHPIDGGVAANNGGGGVAGSHQPGVPGEPAPGVPSDPAPGIPGSPNPGTPGSPTEGVPGDPEPVEVGAQAVDEGPMVEISGAIQMRDYRQGVVRIDIFDGDHRSHVGQRPALVVSATIDRPGPFSVTIPQSAGRVWIEASNDENLDGRPGPRDPSGRYLENPLNLEDGGVQGIVVELEKHDAPPGGVGAEL